MATPFHSTVTTTGGAVPSAVPACAHIARSCDRILEIHHQLIMALCILVLHETKIKRHQAYRRMGLNYALHVHA